MSRPGWLGRATAQHRDELSPCRETVAGVTVTSYWPVVTTSVARSRTVSRLPEPRAAVGGPAAAAARRPACLSEPPSRWPTGSGVPPVPARAGRAQSRSDSAMSTGTCTVTGLAAYESGSDSGLATNSAGPSGSRWTLSDLNGSDRDGRARAVTEVYYKIKTDTRRGGNSFLDRRIVCFFLKS
jgi:hypothetical protein